MKEEKKTKKPEVKFDAQMVEYITAVPKKKRTTKKATKDEVIDKYANCINVKMFADNTVLPVYAHDGDLGMDVVATSVEYDYEHDAFIYGTGIYAESDKHTGCLIFPRSSIYKTDAYLCNSIGLVDSFLYRGEIKMIFKNRMPISQDVMDVLQSAWCALPWYKKLFTNYSTWLNENNDVAQFTVLANVINDYAPYEVGEKIGQLVWLKFPEVNVTQVNTKEELSKTERGEGGFGSTGK